MAGGSKFHLSLNVRDLRASTEFYGKLLGLAPAKMYDDYVKFECEDPALVLALEPQSFAGAGALNHFGIRFGTQDALAAAAQRAAAYGLDAQFLQGIECCYSRQSKAVFHDPDGTLVELYILEADLDHASLHGGAQRAKAAAAQDAARAAVEHLLGTPAPDFGAIPDASVDEVKLRGTFNARMEPAAMHALLAECRRVLKPGGAIETHLLVSDRVFQKQLPKLPGPAANVEVTPVARDVMAAFEEAGFVALEAKRYSHAPVFQFEGAEMRELLFAGHKQAERALDDGRTFNVIYKGPYRQVSDDAGETFRRGEARTVSARQVETLKASGMADAFVFVTATSAPVCGT